MSQDELILGSIGVALFAVVLTALIALLIGITLAYMYPDFTFYFALFVLAMPLLVFGVYMTAPQPSDDPLTVAPGQLHPSRLYSTANSLRYQPSTVVVDTYYPVRVTILLLFSLFLTIGGVYKLVVLTLGAPRYVAPKVKCYRRSCEDLHPMWFK